MSYPALTTRPEQLAAGGSERLAFGRLAAERIAWRIVGEGLGSSLPVVGIHGLGSDARDLALVAERIERESILIDLPGFGASSRGAREHSVTNNVGVVLALLDHLGVERAVWWGCSYGGHVALRAALVAPERVAALALTAPGGLDPDPPAELEAYFQAERLAARSLGTVAANLKALIGQPNPATERYADRRLALHGQAPRPLGNDYPAVAGAARGSLRDDAARCLERITQPVELTRGELDPLVSFATVEGATARIPNANLIHLSGLGHVPWLEAPGAIAAQVRRAIRRAELL